MTITSTHIAEVISAVAQLATAGCVGFGVWVAHNQLSAWRSEHLSKKRSEASEKLLSTAYKAQRGIAATRSAMESVPSDVGSRQDTIIKLKCDRLKSYDEVFETLQELQVVHEAFLGNLEVKAAIDEIFAVRHEVFVAMQMLSSMGTEEETDQEMRKFYQDQKMIIYAVGSAKYDKTSPRVTSEIEILRTNLLPEIRMN